MNMQVQALLMTPDYFIQVEMSGEDSIGVTLAHVDPSLLSCWDGEARGRVHFTPEAQKWEDHSAPHLLPLLL